MQTSKNLYECDFWVAKECIKAINETFMSLQIINNGQGDE